MRWTVMSLIVLLFAGLSPGAPQQNAPKEKAKKQPACVVIEKRDFENEEARTGSFVPSDVEKISIEFKEYGGELLFLEVLPHGTPVEEGDVIARFDTRGIDRQIEQAERAVKAAELELRNTRERNAMARESAKSALDDAQFALQEARRSLKGWKEYELAFSKRGAEMSLQYAKDSIEDQKDELEQLEAMYRDDELTDATEEIVLKRARRGLARSIKALELQKDRRAYTVAFSEEPQTKRRERAVAAQERALDHLRRNQEIEARSRAAAIENAEIALGKKRESLERLKQDRTLLTLRAGRRGVLLHGAPEDYGPGRTAPRYKRFDRAAARKTLFTVAVPDRFEVALDVPESKLKTLHTGLAAKVTPVLSPSLTVLGTLRVDRFPDPKRAGGPENSFRASIELTDRIPGIVPGMRAKVKIVVDRLDGVFVLPKKAIFGSGKDTHCWAAAPGTQTYQRVALKLGPEKNGEVVVYGDLAEKGTVLLCAPEK